MRKIALYLFAFITATVWLSSCDLYLPEEVSFDKTLLTGKWQSGTLFYKYIEDGTGSTWDTIDDVTEEEAQLFTWTLENAELTHIHVIEIGGNVPKVYTVTELTDSTLNYHDDFGKNFSFEKILP
jgi:hypothetical protein